MMRPQWPPGGTTTSSIMTTSAFDASLAGFRGGPQHPIEHPVVDLMDDAFAMAEAAASVDPRGQTALLHRADGVVLLDGDVPAPVVALDDLVEVRALDDGPRKAGPVDQRRPIRPVRLQLQLPARADGGRAARA